MKKSELFEEIRKIDDPVKDYGKILSNLHYTHFFLMDKYKKILSDYNLTSQQSNVLGIISYFSPKSISLETIKEMVLEPSSDVSRIVVRLTEKGFAEKVVDKENRRKVSIKITAEGLKMVKKIGKDKRFYKFTSALSKNEAMAFIHTLEKLRQG